MLIIKNKIIPFGKHFFAINLFGILFAKGECDETIINHESIHTAQIKELLYIFFYLLYVIEWLIRVIQYRGCIKGYQNISFEREAYTHQHDLEYLGKRRRFEFTRYMR